MKRTWLTDTGIGTNGPSLCARIARVFDRGGWFLGLVGSAYGICLASFFFVWMADPYSLRPGGVAVRLVDRPYADEIVPRLVSVAANDGSDLLVVGGSTSMGFTPEMLREAFPEAQKPFNLSYVGLMPSDLKTIMSLVETSPSLKRLILVLDFSMIRGLDKVSNRSEMRYYNGGWHDPVPEFDAESIALAWTVLRKGVLDKSTWRRKRAERPDFMLYASPVTTRPGSVAKLSQAVDTSRDWVTHAPLIECSKILSLQQIVFPSVQRLAARGVAVELLLPPYSLAVYSDWSLNFPDGYFFSGNGGVYANLMGLKRCTVDAAEGIANVRVHAFDTDFSITTDLSRYLDSSHVYDLDTYRGMLHRMAKGDAALTKARWSQFSETLVGAINTFKLQAVSPASTSAPLVSEAAASVPPAPVPVSVNAVEPGRKAQPVTCPAAEPGTKVIVAFGSSNAANFGGIAWWASPNVWGTDHYTAGPEVIVFDWQMKTCFRAIDPLPGAGGQGASVWGRFGDELIARGRAKRVLILAFGESSSWAGDWVDDQVVSYTGQRLGKRLSTAAAALAAAGYKADFVAFQSGEASKENYPAKLDALAARVSALFGRPMTVSVSTLCRRLGDPATVRDAVARNGSSMLLGPDLDSGVAHALDRTDMCHFSGQGLSKAAKLWADVEAGR